MPCRSNLLKNLWTPHGTQAYFGGAVALAKAIRWESAEDEADGVMTPEEIMDKLEARAGPEGRKLFEQFLRKVNKLQAQQYLEAQAQIGRPGPQIARR
jgi:hypothetical protein